MCLGCVLKVLLCGWYPTWNTSGPPREYTGRTVRCMYFIITMITEKVFRNRSQVHICRRRGGHHNKKVCTHMCLPENESKGPFQRHVCDQKSGKFNFWMATAPGANMLWTSFWLIIVLPVRVKTYRSLKIKFFVKVKNKVHVTIGHVCDFAWNCGPAPNDFKVKILWCVMEFCIEQYTDDGQHIYKQFHMLRMKFYRISFDVIFCLVTFVTFWCNVWVTFVTFLI